MTLLDTQGNDMFTGKQIDAFNVGNGLDVNESNKKIISPKVNQYLKNFMQEVGIIQYGNPNKVVSDSDTKTNTDNNILNEEGSEMLFGKHH